MLKLTIPENEFWVDKTQEFVHVNETTITLEHSLISLAKWESRWNKAYLSDEAKTQEETIDYIRCMTTSQNVDPNIYYFLTRQNLKEINDYINLPMTATTFSEESKPSRKKITAEIIYYWMISFNIPMECQKWHLNRLLTLIRVCSIKNQPEKKMSSREILARNKRLNAQRKSALHTKG